MIRSKSGFTIVELLIVIVVIAILAAITIVAYSGIQSRAKDSKRQEDLANVQRALEIYHATNGGYPACTGGTYQPGTATQSCALSTIATALVPSTIGSLPTDPVNSGQKIYRYGVGWKYTARCTTVTNNSDNYLLGAALDDTSQAACAGFWGQQDVNYVLGTAN